MEYEEELFAERVRRKAQAERLASGEVQWTDQLVHDLRVKLNKAWDDITRHRAFHNHGDALELYIHERTLDSLAVALDPSHMQATKADNDCLLSLVEVEHEALAWLAANPNVDSVLYPGASAEWHAIIQAAPEIFRNKVNELLAAYLVAFHLHYNSRLVPVDSHEMHDAVVEPTLYLLNSQPRFADAEKAYQKALKELRNRDAGDAITDAATALQDVLTALGCKGGALGDLLNSAKKKGLVEGNDTPLTEAVCKTVDWVAAKRNQGEAHKGDPDIDMSDAWMLVHVVGALVIRLSESSQGGL